MRTVANKSKLKIAIIQAIDRKIDLNEVAESNCLDFDQLLDEIEAIVNAGTRINISYFIDEIIDPRRSWTIFSTISAVAKATVLKMPTKNCAAIFPNRKYAL